MNNGKITVVGIGPGSAEDITPAVRSVLHDADVVVGYKLYFKYITPFLRPETNCVDTGMKSEEARAQQAFELAEGGGSVCVISSGDAGIYGMASLVFEMKNRRGSDVDVECMPGISAFQKAAALLGAPVSHDFCVISLSDLLTPWQLIERRIKAAAQGDFVTAVYNPRSKERYWQLDRLRELFLKEGRAADTPVGYVRQAGRPEQEVHTTTLGELDTTAIDMFTILIIGNSQSYTTSYGMITPRGYYHRSDDCEGRNMGQNIMIRSFRTIDGELRDRNIPIDRKWALLHAIHTTADFDMENLLVASPEAVSAMYEAIVSGRVKTIVTDVTMVSSGIRKGALQRLGVEVKCYLGDPRTIVLATEKGITRSQAGIRLAVEEHPDAIFAFGNAPTALIELCDLMRKGKARPAGVIAAPVGFVHVEESKHRVKTFKDVPQIIIEGRKGGSNLAATLVNSVLCYNDAAELKPGRDV